MTHKQIVEKALRTAEEELSAYYIAGDRTDHDTESVIYYCMIGLNSLHHLIDTTELIEMLEKSKLKRFNTEKGRYWNEGFNAALDTLIEELKKD